MTSQQPPTGKGYAAATGAGRETAGPTGKGTGPQAGGYPSRLVPVALLVVLILMGLRGGEPRLAWEGPLHREAEIIGIALEVVLGAGLVIVFIRGRGEGTEAAQKLRTGLQAILGAGMVALAVALLVNAHLHLTVKSQPKKLIPAPAFAPNHAHCAPHQAKAVGGGLDIRWVLFLLLIIVIIAVVIVVLRRGGLGPGRGRAPVPAAPIATDADTLREAISEGAAALRAGAFDDARKAIIACYVAMERSLADRGAARNEADTPDELLSRATQAGIVHGAAASRLTALFYEARFSSHPLGDDQHRQARQALDEIAASLDQPPVVTG
jgi:hypothetical protein